MARVTIERRFATHIRPACITLRLARARRSRSIRHQVLSVTAFKPQDETISVAFDGYNLLQACL